MVSEQRKWIAKGETMSIKKLALEPTDIVVLSSRSLGVWIPEVAQGLVNKIRERFPDWVGSVVLLDGDEGLETLPRERAIEILEAIVNRVPEKVTKLPEPKLWKPGG